MNICRVCLEPATVMYPLFGEVLHVDGNIASMLSYCASVEVSSHTGYDVICISCFKTVRIAYNFIQKFKKNQDLLFKEQEKSSVEYIEIRIEDPDEEIGENVVIEDEECETLDLHTDNNDYSSEIETPLNKLNISGGNVKEEFEKDDSSDIGLMEQVDFEDSLLDATEANPNVEDDTGLLDEGNNSKQTFIDESSVSKLTTAVHPSIYKCPICNKAYRKFQTLTNHIRTHVDIIFPCAICTDIFDNTALYIEHYKSLHLYHCTNCDKSFKCKSTYRYHSKYAHSKVKLKFLCRYENCGKSFSFKHSLKRHEDEHKDYFKYTCKSCNASFKSYDKYRYHTRIIHENDRPHLCTICGRTFVQLTHLKDHMWTHTGVKRYKCKYCGKGYTSSSHLKKHVMKICSALEPA